MLWRVFLLCLGAVSGRSTGTTKSLNRLSTFLDILQDKSSSDYDYGLKGLNGLPVELPLRSGGGGVNLPVLLLPVPVFAKGPDTCQAHNDKEPSRSTSYVVSQEPIYGRSYLNPTRSQPRQLLHKEPTQPIINDVSSKFSEPEENEEVSKPNYNIKLGDGANKVHYNVDPSTSEVDEQNKEFDPYVILPSVESEDVKDDQPIPFSEGRDPLFENSEDLRQSYLNYPRRDARLPAVLPSGRQLPDRIPTTESDPPLDSIKFGPAPPRPNFDRSLRLRIDLTVPRAGYTEAYDIEWHTGSNTARTVVEDGSTVIYRVPLLDGRVQFLEVKITGTTDNYMRRCTISPIMEASSGDKAFPGLPDLDSFYFVGHSTAEGRSRVERWHSFVIGKPGEGGAAPGESLNFTHQMFIIRDGDDAVPLKYAVTTVSSVLGWGSDSYTHRYSILAEPTAPILPDTAHECDVIEQLKEDNRPRRDVNDIFSGVQKFGNEALTSIFNPLRGFLGPMRDPHFDSTFTDFTGTFRRKYKDAKEESIRKAQFINTSRFVAAANRVAVSFKTGVNFFADRVTEELNWLFGVAPPPEETPPGAAPPEFSFGELKSLAKELPMEYDWRDISGQSGVSPVQFQGHHCMSCWAFAVAGSTEGALFNKAKKLVPLSPQSLVDCGMPFTTNGCNETWPEFGYGYIQERGLPSWDDYMYTEQVQECKANVQPVTRISGYRNVSATVEGIKVAIHRNAPTVVIIGARPDLQTFISYTGGVYHDQHCMGLNHAVLAIGWGTNDGSHFIIKNSWGAGWGEKGYMRMDPGVCSVTERPSHAIVEDADILREDLKNVSLTTPT